MWLHLMAVLPLDCVRVRRTRILDVYTWKCESNITFVTCKLYIVRFGVKPHVHDRSSVSPPKFCFAVERKPVVVPHESTHSAYQARIIF